MRGSLCYNHHRGFGAPTSSVGDENQKTEHLHPMASRGAFDFALEVLAEPGGRQIESLLTHVFPLEQFRDALALATRRSAEASIKIALAFQDQG